MRKYPVVFIYLVLILSTLVVFLQARNFDFVNFDDNKYVYENPEVLNGLTIDGIIWAFTTNVMANWHPLTWLSLMLDCQMFGKNPGDMHIVNVLFHLANTLLLFAVLRKMTGTLWPSAFAAAAFAVHPMHVESVAWIAERKDVLSTFFLFLTMLSYAAYVRKKSIFRYLLTLFLFATGLLSKPMLVTLPFLLILLDYWPLERIRKGQFSFYKSVIEKIPFIILTAVASVITFFVQLKEHGVIDLAVLSLKGRILNVFISYARYIYKLFWPQKLAVFYPLDYQKFALWQVAMCVLLLAAVTILVIYLRQKRKYLVTGWFWFAGTLIPVIGLVHIGLQAYADRYTYIPYTGLFIMIAWGLPDILSKWKFRKTALGLSMAAALSILGFYAHRQAGFWKDNMTLFSHANEVTQDNYLAHQNLGAAYSNAGSYRESIEEYRRAIQIKANDSRPYFGLGIVYGKLGRGQEEIESYKQALKLEPDNVEAMLNLGAAYEKQGLYQEAAESYRQAIKIKMDYADAYFNLGIVYCKLGQYQDAAEACQKAIKIRPNFVESYVCLGISREKLGQYQNAIESYRQAIRIKPEYADAYYNLGVVYGVLGRGQEAIEAYKKTITIKPDYTTAYYNIGISYQGMDRYEEAIVAYKKTVLIEPNFADAHYNLGIIYSAKGQKDSAVKEYKILKNLDPEKANKLLDLINK
jgi:tetratricopeptide (TPR) repeat protein